MAMSSLPCGSALNKWHMAVSPLEMGVSYCQMVVPLLSLVVPYCQMASLLLQCASQSAKCCEFFETYFEIAIIVHQR